MLRAEDAMARLETPGVLDYKTMEGSVYNTPPCWSIYMCGLVFKHFLSLGGLEGVHQVLFYH